MAMITCPSCGLPRAPDLYGATACPVCGTVGMPPPADGFAEELPDEPEGDGPWVIDPEPARAVPPVAAQPRPPAEPAPRAARTGSRFVPGVLLGFVVGSAAGAAGVFGWQGAFVRSPGTSAVARADTDPPESPPAGEPDVAPLPRPIAVAEATPVTEPPPPAPEPAPGAAPGAPAGPAPGPAPGAVPAVQPPAREGLPVGPQPEAAPANPFRPAVAPAMRLDNPEGTSAPVVRPGGQLVLRGRVKKLVVSGLEGGAVLDCSELDAAEVTVTGKIDGGSRLLVRAENGWVLFRARVAGGSRVGVVAPGGAVTFTGGTGDDRNAGQVDGGSVVEVKARAVNFDGRIQGAKTRVAVTLTAGGVLRFAEVTGAARLEYGRADPDDPQPTVVRGKVGPDAAVSVAE